MDNNNNTNFYIETSALGEYARRMAGSYSDTAHISGRDICSAIRRDLRRLQALSNCDSPPPGSAMEWLTDNWYLARREALSAAGAFRFCGKLPASRDQALIRLAADDLLRAGDGQITQERIAVFLEAWQTRRVLPRLELDLFIPALKAAAVSALAQGGEELNPERAGRLFTTLRFLGSHDLSRCIDSLDLTERALMAESAGVYPRMTERTRDSYRRRMAALAKKQRLPEHMAARRLLRRSAEAAPELRHVGFLLFSEDKSSGLTYIAANLLPTLSLSIALGLHLGPLAALLLLLPFSAAVKALTDLVLLRTLTPRYLPRMELKNGVPPEGKTLCVISAIISDKAGAKELCARLEEACLCSRGSGENLIFGLLADLPESTEKELPGARKAMAEAARLLEELSRRYDRHFLLLTRPRVQREGKYMGWERKRGAILELARAMRGQDCSIRCLAGDLQALMGARYILTLDSDTHLTPGSALELIGAMLHPLNKPVIDEKRGVVVSGHGIIQPRMSTQLRSAVRTPFARLFAGQGGIDPYSSLCGEVYMNLTGSSVFSGKGILDVDAFLRCAGNFPEGQILSHDALEGAVLRCGWAGDIELTDSFPGEVLSFYRRAHRWIRGDWQNSPWLFSRGANLSDLDRWRLLDSLRRSLVSPAVLLCLLWSFFGGRAAVGLIAMGCFIINLILAALHSIIHRPETGERYHSTVISGLPGSLCQSAVSFILLPLEAFTAISAILTALWRMLVTRQSLLEWSPAGQDSRRGVTAYIRAMLPEALLGLACIWLSPAVIGKASGVLWMFSPLAACMLSRVCSDRRSRLSCRDRCWLLTRAREMWGYFDAFMDGENHYLPPDNWQERPPVGLARRTSPTNIGLALISTLSAADLGIIEPDTARERIDATLTTIEALPKWKGHLYNWYSTQTLEVLQPPYVSTVDSGNLCACLIALSQGLTEYGFADSAGRARELAGAMDFSPLLDREKLLLRIGINTAEPDSGSGCYDLLAGEARLSAYLAVARGDIPKKVWERMSRCLVAKGHRRGMASWTGTMFEYLMPELLLPLAGASLLYETAHFCLYVQRRRAPGKPWGCSESAYHALDPSLSYRYKAHGCQALALKPGMDDELVISPYSSFLAMSVDAPAAVHNLQELEKLGALGRYGFWEALDYTPSRMRSGEPEMVRCVMAHHLGMSLISVANVIQNGVWRKRFMRESAMGAYGCLLEERIPLNAPVLRRSPLNPAEKQRPDRHRGLWSKSGGTVEGDRLYCNAVTNGTYSVMSTSCGHSTSYCGDILMYAPSDLRPGSGHGIDFFIWDGEHSRSLLPGVAYAFTQREVSIQSRPGSLSANMALSVCADCSGERRIVSLTPDGEGLSRVMLTMSMKPALAFEKDYVNHPAFFGLGLEARSIPGGVLIRRLRRGRLDACWLCVKCSHSFEADLSENSVSPRARRGRQPEGWLVRPNLRLDVPLELTGGRTEEIRFALGFGADAEQAETYADRALAMDAGNTAALPELSAALLGLDAGDVDDAMGLMPPILFPRVKNAANIRDTDGRGGLWPLGISGDLPLVVYDASAPELIEDAERTVKLCAYLHSLSIPFDLAVMVADGGDYLRPNESRISRLLAHHGLEHLLGANGGVHLLDVSKDLSALKNSACLLLPEDGTDAKYIYNNIFMLTNPLLSNGGAIPEFRFPDGESFEFYVNHSLPPVTWTNMLTNGRFGYLAADCGTGFMWMDNAREQPISPWLNAPAAVTGHEILELETDSGQYSLFASPEGQTRIRYAPGTAVWDSSVNGLHLRVTAFVPPETDARVLLLESSKPVYLRWKLPLSLSSDRGGRPFVVTDYVNSTLSARSARADAGATFSSLCSCGFSGFTCDGGSAARGEYDEKTGAVAEPCFAARISVPGRAVLVCGCDGEEQLRALAEPQAADRALEYTRRYWRCRTSRLKVSTPYPELDRALSPWLPYQTEACRIMGRTSVYQSGGALGFRDQLQDVVSLLLTQPQLCRAHILSACRHQYLEGDVQHWWHPHPDGDRGVRTHCSDDLVWLPWAVCEYAEKTGDLSVLDEEEPFLISPELGADDHDRYETPALSGESLSVREHCARALDMVLRRGTGEHGLLKMLSGDWNDGMDKVGGESVWLTWFFASTARRFSELTGEERYVSEAEKLTRAADAAWDTDHWLRGYFESGEPLGASESRYCRIDSIAQSFACLCSVPKEKLDAALDSALSALRMGKLTALFTPAFEDEGPDPGYIRSYGPGFRENGGQYTHAAVWLAMACLRCGRREDGLKILLDILPENHDALTYGAEPFVLPADVSTNPDHFGRAGWTWYTGSAGWYWRVAAEDLLGLHPRGGRLYIEPSPTPGLDSWGFTWQDKSGERYTVAVDKGEVTVNGAAYDGKGLPL
ncbi:MAG: GH36-type glycosyl hydrolase domain-containing protein [Candidatus Heteroscillospira sp.]|jgi:cyclic beta-1,2-glucan synthetase